MEEKLFGLDISRDYFEVVKRDDRFFLRYDAGSHQPAWREDEISAEEAQRISLGQRETYAVVLDLQKRLGPSAFQTNWNPE